MRIKKLVYIAIFVVSLAACEKDSIIHDADSGQKNENIEGEYEKGWIRVKFKQLNSDLNTVATRSGKINTGIDEIDEVVEKLGATAICRVFNEGGKFKERREKYGLHLWYDLYIGDNEPITKSINSFKSLNNVEVVELIPIFRQKSQSANYFFSSALRAGISSAPFSLSKAAGDGTTFNDPLLARQWHYNNDGSTASSVAGADANIFAAWKITTGDPRVIVAVVDGGIDHNHPDLARNMWINTGEIPGNGIDDDNNGYIDDIYGYRWGKDGLAEPTGTIFPMDHGSHCAGVIAAVNNNGIGIAGVGGGNGDPLTGVRLMSCQTYVPDPAYPNDPHGNSKSTSQTPDAFAYAADNGAVIVSCSFSYGGTTLSAAYKAGIDYFVDNAGYDENNNPTGPLKGGLMVASAGNDGELKAVYPAAYEKVISVAYSMSNYQKSPSSNYGPSVDVTAPGGATSSSYAADRVGGIFSTIAFESANYDVEKGYSYKSGSSMAAPHVAGVAALIVSAAIEKNMVLTVERLRDIILRSCWSLDKYNSEYAGMLGEGQVDAGYALEILLGGESQPVPPPIDLTSESDKNSITLSWKVPADYLGKPIVSVELYIALKSLEGVNFEQLPSWIIKETVENEKTAGDRVEKKFSNLDDDTEYFFALISVDRQGQKSQPAFIKATTQSQIQESEGKSFSVYPTGVDEKLYIKPSSAVLNEKVSVEIYNAVGYRVFKTEVVAINKPFELNLKDLTVGYYFVSLKTKQTKEVHKIIKH